MPRSPVATTPKPGPCYLTDALAVLACRDRSASMARRSDSSCRQCRGARHVCPARPDPGDDDLVSDRDERWPLAGQELARLRLGSIADL